MNPWPFVLAAYGLTVLGVIGLSWAGWRVMRDAEAKADTLRLDR